jgi:anaerobic selenocysteine-containing dehydrogenase
VWDASEGEAKIYNDPSIGDYALEGRYHVNGQTGHPSFELLKEHLRKYTPQMASQVSGVPSEIITRIATEFAQAAQIGSTITIEGHQLPFRPVASVTLRGAEGHENAGHTAMAVCLLNQLVGAADVPGAVDAHTCLGYRDRN